MSQAATTAAPEPVSALWETLENRDQAAVRRALARRRKTPRDLALLLSVGADALLDEIAERARRVALERVGRAVQLYAPLYVSNRCVGGCPYCGFRADRSIERRVLTLDEIASEATQLERSGLRHVLLVAGDDPRRVDVGYLCAAIRVLRRSFASVAIEVAPLAEAGYRALVEAGADGVTLYQETYDEEVYHAMHARGPKADYHFRLEALDRAGAAGMRKLTAGVLFGLAPWRRDALRLGLHMQHLMRRWWRSSVSFGVPRLRWVPADFVIPHPFVDRSLIHVMIALRAYLGDVGIAVSTRESPELRDSLVPLGVTMMSAGSRTEPGGYSEPGVAGDQFEISDSRSPAEVAAALCSLGYDPVFKDWDRGLGPA